MSILVVNNFVKKRGIEALFRFQEMLNQGKKLDEIAAYLGVSDARVTILRDKIFEKRYSFHPHVLSYLRSQINIYDFKMGEIKNRLMDCGDSNVIAFNAPERKIH